MELRLDTIQSQIDVLWSASDVQRIHKGYSADNKYLVTTETGDKVLLRIMPIEQLERKSEEFEILARLHSTHAKVPRPLHMGTVEHLKICYYVLSYIEGDDARDELPRLTPGEQYEVGIQAGRDLRKIHQLKAPTYVAPWYSRIVRKHQRYVEAYVATGIHIKREGRIFDLIEQSKEYMKDRPNLLQHDDFHVGNIIVNDRLYAGAIDFNRYDWGDPWHDLLKMGFFSSEVSELFCVGQVHGYFRTGGVPNNFWRLYSAYLAMTLVSSVSWTLRVVPDEMDSMLERIHRVLDDHDYFESDIPRWYVE